MIMHFKTQIFLLLLLSALLCTGAEKKDIPPGQAEPGKKSPVDGNLIEQIGQEINGGEIIPYEQRTAYVFNVKNKSFKNLITQELTRKIQLELEKRGRLLLVEDKNKAHVLIYTSFDFFKKMPVTWDTLGRPTNVDIMAFCVVKVRSRDQKEKSTRDLIDPTKVEARVNYNVRGDNTLAEFESLSRLTDQLAARIALVVETGWYTELKSDRELGQLRDQEGIIGKYDTDEVKKPGTSNLSEEEEIKEMENKSLGKKEPAPVPPK